MTIPSPEQRLPGLTFQPGDAYRAVLRGEKRIRASGFQAPDPMAFCALAEAVEEMTAGDAEYRPDVDPSQADTDCMLQRVRRLNSKVGAIEDGMFLVAELCDSPIETQLGLWALLLGADGYNDIGSAPSLESRFDPDWGTNLVPQAKVGRYRVDLMFKVCLKGLFRLLAVECDGHQYHERTPDQASRDRSRDRFMTIGRVTVLRFTGREIFHDPARCLEQIQAALETLTEDLLVTAGITSKSRNRWFEEHLDLDGNPARTGRNPTLH